MESFRIAGIPLKSSRWPESWGHLAASRLRFGVDARGSSVDVQYMGTIESHARSDEMMLNFHDGVCFFSRADMCGEYALADRVLRVWTASSSPHWITLENALRVLCSVLFPLERKGLMLHAACCVSNGCAFVFPGVSGAGKSTLAASFEPSTYLSDDISIVEGGEESVRLLPTPFFGTNGKLGVETQAPLKAIAILSQSRHTTVSRLSYAESISSLLRHVVVFDGGKYLPQIALDRVVEISARVPVFAVERSLVTSAEQICSMLLQESGGGENHWRG